MPEAPAPDLIDAWIFDLDNTLYPADCRLFEQVSGRMSRFVADHLGLDLAQARAVQKRLFHTYGTTLRGLMTEYGVEPEAFLAFVHDIDLSVLRPDPDLAAVLADLPGRKFVYTNADGGYAARILDRLGLAARFDGVFDIQAADYVPKPEPRAFDRLIAALDITPTRTVMIEDIARNLVPAAQRGMTTVWVPTGNDWAREGSGDGHIDHIADDLATWLGQWPDVAGRPAHRS